MGTVCCIESRWQEMEPLATSATTEPDQAQQKPTYMKKVRGLTTIPKIHDESFHSLFEQNIATIYRKESGSLQSKQISW